MNYTQLNHQYYCGIDLHAKTMFVCVMDKDGNVCFHRNLPNDFDRFSQQMKPYLKDMAVGVESTYCYYWLADACKEAGIPFYLGHAYYMKAIGKAKNKNDKLDSKTIADLLRANMFPLAYAYPQEMREARDLLRRRHRLVHIRAEAYSHIKQIFHQQGIYNVGEKEVKDKDGRRELLNRFVQVDLRANLQADLGLIESFDPIIHNLELHIRNQAKHHNRRDYEILLTTPGIGEMLSLVILYETHDIKRFPSPQDYASYSRVIKAERSSAGKSAGGSGKLTKIGNPYLKWAFNEIILVAKRYCEPIGKYYQRLEAKHGPKLAKSRIAHKFAVTTYYMLKNGQGFDEKRFIGQNN